METRLNVPSHDDWVYLAGLIDGEACLAINRQQPRKESYTKRYCAAVKLTNCYEPVMHWLVKTFGSAYYISRRADGVRKASWQWIATSGEAVWVCKGVLPYLQIKRRQAECLIDVEDPALGPRRHGIRVPPEEVARREKLYWEVRALNEKGDKQRLNERTASSGQM